MMFDRMKRNNLMLRAAAASSAADANAGEYHGLYKYLRDRYANRIVLTFGEIEDLLGFSLPEHARVQIGWWGSAAAVGLRSSATNAWTLAGRSAVVNLLAQTVVFERVAV
jgi:hypothetical protein